MTFVFLEAADQLAKSTLASLAEAGADIRVMLLMSNNNALSVRDTAVFVADITTLDEFNGAGYTAGGQALTTQALTKDTANDRVELTADANVWNPLSAGTREISAALVYVFVTNNSDSRVLALYDSGNLPAMPNGGPFTITWSADGLIQFRCTLS